ncbi:hypothetical protein [Agromyces humi]|uniref:hypothetical protein n=1 Tax=Agromyces humi TaxID=1766800 RepID=UPI001358E620|nr:hypothetical protein [Agromyces humi]
MSRHTYDGVTLEEAKAKVRAAHTDGSKVEVISAEEVSRPGFGGFFAKTRYEIVVEVDDEDPASAYTLNSASGGLQALLAAEDAADGYEKPAAPDRFEQVIAGLRDLTDGTEDTTTDRYGLDLFQPSPVDVLERAVQVPVISKRPGDLVVLVGRPDDVVAAAKTLSRGGRYADVRPGGEATIRSAEPVVDRRSSLHARAAAVERERPVYVAYGVAAAGYADLESVSPDELWLVVDAAMKPEDTAAWARPLIAAQHVDGLIVIRASETLTPGTVNLLQVPVGYVDGKPADTPTL